MNPVSSTHLVLIPSYNAGQRLYDTVREARRAWTPVWVVVDGSTDDSLVNLQRMAQDDPGLRVLSLPVNSGKGAAVLHGMRAARAEGFTHILTMDADGQHPADLIGTFMEASMRRPEAVILGQPIFDESAPAIRLRGRRIANWWTDLETGKGTIGDSLFGFRVYPIADLMAVMDESPGMRRFDFDPEAAVRLAWRGLPVVNLPAPCRYFRPEEGGVSHFNYLRDNVLLFGMHVRLVFGAIGRSLGIVGSRR